MWEACVLVSIPFSMVILSDLLSPQDAAGMIPRNFQVFTGFQFLPTSPWNLCILSSDLPPRKQPLWRDHMEKTWDWRKDAADPSHESLPLRSSNVRNCPEPSCPGPLPVKTPWLTKDGVKHFDSHSHQGKILPLGMTKFGGVCHVIMLCNQNTDLSFGRGKTCFWST